MDAWDTLLTHSTLDSTGFDAWEHFNAQEGGTGIGVILIDGMEVEMECTEFDAELDMTVFDAEIEFEMEVEIEPTEYEVEVCNG